MEAPFNQEASRKFIASFFYNDAMRVWQAMSTSAQKLGIWHRTPFVENIGDMENNLEVTDCAIIYADGGIDVIYRDYMTYRSVLWGDAPAGISVQKNLDNESSTSAKLGNRNGAIIIKLTSKG